MIGEWMNVSVAQLAAPSASSMSTGPFGSSIGSRFFRQSGVPIIRGGNLSTDPTIRLRDEDLAFLDREKAAEFSRSTVRRGDLIFTCWGTINQVGLIDDSCEYAKYVISNKQMKLTPDLSIADPEFLYYVFSAPPMQREILEGSIGSSIPGFNLTRLRSLRVNLPPLLEQKRIARAIVDAEAVEKRLGHAIAKKQAIKQSVMQQLLTGKTRLPGFTSPWRTNASIIDVARRFAGYWGSDPGELEVEARIIRAGDVGSDHRIIGHAVRSLTRDQYERSRCKPGDVVLTASGTIGNVALVDSDEFTASNFVRVLRPHDGLLGEFLYYFLQSFRAVTVMTSHLGASAMPNLGSSFYADPFLEIPTLPEQRAIVEVLSDADREIEALRGRRAKARNIKQGTMQELLTGRARLAVAEGSA